MGQGVCPHVRICASHLNLGLGPTEWWPKPSQNLTNPKGSEASRPHESFMPNEGLCQSKWIATSDQQPTSGSGSN